MLEKNISYKNKNGSKTTSISSLFSSTDQNSTSKMIENENLKDKFYVIVSINLAETLSITYSI